MAKVKYYAKENSTIGTHSFYAVPIPNGTLSFDTLGDLCKLHKIDWLKFRNGGKKSLFELDDLLAANGLEWAKC